MIKKEIAYIERLPKFYGIAYYHQHKASVVCYPIPINLIVRFFNWIRWKIKNPGWATIVDQYNGQQSQLESLRQEVYLLKGLVKKRSIPGN